jgi:hypothetical protein
MELDGEKSIRIPYLQRTPNRFIPSAWRSTRAPIHPRILLTSRMNKMNFFGTDLKLLHVFDSRYREGAQRREPG